NKSFNVLRSENYYPKPGLPSPLGVKFFRLPKKASLKPRKIKGLQRCLGRIPPSASLESVSGLPMGTGLPRLRHDSQVRLRGLPAARIDLFGLLVRDRAGDDDVLALLPIGGGGDLVLGGQLKGIDHPEHLVEIASCGHGVDQDQLDLLVRADDEH